MWLCFFFFKQKTAYDMRISDWSSDVCSSDLVHCYAVAASTGKQPDDLADRVLGDGLVSIDSALGRHRDRARALAIPESRQWIGYGINHLQLLDHPAVYAQLRQWLAQ